MRKSRRSSPAQASADEAGSPNAARKQRNGRHVRGSAPGASSGNVAAGEGAVAGPADRLRPYVTGGAFLNFVTDPARTASAFTAGNHRRLAGVKATWDPGNMFRFNHNIPPAAGLEAAS